jgi:tetratricopeptide (TPR) repeat protein
MRKSLVFILLLFSTKIFGQPNCFENKEHPLPAVSEQTKKLYESKLAEATAEYKKDSTNADAIIWLGRRIAYTGNYNEAINVFSKGIALHPGDARFYRHRGHRYITLRCFDKAIADFEKASLLIKGKQDEVEPDGLPNAQNTPTSTLQSNIWYHLGLAYFVKGEYKLAETAYRNGLTVSKNDDMYVAMANWLLISLLSQREQEEAATVFFSVSPTPKLIENTDYISLLYYYVHRPADNEIERYTQTMVGKDTLTVKAATLYFGAGYYSQVMGMTAKAKLFFEKAIATGQWSSFGFIAAEAELARMK